MLRKLKISQKLVFFMCLIGIIPLAVGIFIAENQVKSQLKEEILASLETVQKIKHNQLKSYLINLMNSVEFIASTDMVRNQFLALKGYHDRLDVGAESEFPVDSPEYRQIWQQGSGKMMSIQEAYKLRDILIICSAHGHVMYSNSKGDDLGANLKYGKYKDTPLAQAFNGAITKKRMVIVDFQAYAPANGEPAAFIATPFFDNQGQMMGILAAEIDLKEINNIMQERAGIGEYANSFETYCVGNDKRMRSDSFVDKSGNHSVKASFAGTIEKNGVDTVAVHNALEGKSGKELLMDYYGNWVFSSYSPLVVDELKWVVLAEIDKSEALAPADKLRNVLILILILLGITVAIIAYFLSRGISNPINDLVSRTANMASGEADLTKRIQLNRQDELGELGGHFNRFIERLQKLINDVKQNTDAVSSGALQISSSTEEMAATIEEQSTQSQAVSTAMTQLAATSDDISRSIENTRESAEQAAQSTRAGGKVIQQTISSLKSIENQTGKLGEIIDSLGQSTRKIGDIINVINDVADQTNLLALNAAIEAARAGDAGRGFAVVADEVRKLAERTAKATKEIEEIITQLQKEAENADKAMNETAKEVKKGTTLGEQSLQILDKIVTSSDGILNAAVSVASAITEENTTIEEVNNNIQGIAAASEESANAVQEVASTAEDLSRQADKLKHLVDQFIT